MLSQQLRADRLAPVVCTRCPKKQAMFVLMQAALGSGSEMVMDVAPGVDWTAMVAILMAVQQVRWVATSAW